jgi:hypothetical protein
MTTAIAGQHTFAGQHLPSRGLTLFLAGIFLFGASCLLAGQLGRRSLQDSPGDDEGLSPRAGEATLAGPVAWAVGGLALLFGLYGYMAFRAMPVVVAVCLALKFVVDLIAKRGTPNLHFLGNSSLLMLAALLVYAPLGRYAIQFHDNYWYRIMTRGAADRGRNGM